MMKTDYDALAAEYARHRRIHPGVLKGLVEQGSLSSCSSVLEVGCGTGNYLEALEKTLGCEGWGVEPSVGMRREAEAKLHPGRILAGQAERLPFPDAQFDLVFSVDVIHHVGDRSASIREAFRVLKPGGKICTVTDSEEIIRNRVPLASHFPETVVVELARYPRIQDLRGMMTQAGFDEIREDTVALAHALTDLGKYRDKAYSSLHLIPETAFQQGMARLEAELEAKGVVEANARYLMLWGTRPR